MCCATFPNLPLSDVSTNLRLPSASIYRDLYHQCFGLNTYGQLGQGDNFTRGSVPDQLGDNLTAVDLGTGLTAVAIATGCSHTCAILDDGSVKCFGFNNHGQLGQV